MVVAIHEMLIRSKPPAIITITDKFVGGDGLSRYDKNGNFFVLQSQIIDFILPYMINVVQFSLSPFTRD